VQQQQQQQLLPARRGGDLICMSLILAETDASASDQSPLISSSQRAMVAVASGAINKLARPYRTTTAFHVPASKIDSSNI